MKITFSKKIIPFILFLFLLFGLGLTIFQVKQRQEVRQRAESVSCEVIEAICRWDNIAQTSTYIVTITDSSGKVIAAKQEVSYPTNQYIFPAQKDKTYKCEVSAKNACGEGPKASALATCPGVTPTPIPSNTPTPTPTSTPKPTPTLTPTPIVMTPTPIPTSTPAPILPTPTSMVIVNTPVPTVAVVTPTPLPTITPVSPGENNITKMVGLGGLVLVILGGVIALAL